MQVVAAADAPAYYDSQNRSARSGANGDKLLLAGREGSLNNYKLTLGSVVSEYTTPRHRHNFEQVRYPLNGDYGYAKDQAIPAGWVGYFPEGTYYGPQTQKEQLQLINLQFGGPTGNGYMSKRERQGAYAALSAKGKFEKGYFTWIDEAGRRHNQDSYEAMWEQANGRKILYPPPRYRESIIMNPANFAWMESPQEQGIAHKLLGTFTEREIRIGFVKFEPGATCTLGQSGAPEILFLTKGRLTVGAHGCPTCTAIEIEDADGPVSLHAEEASELLRVRLPKFAAAEHAGVASPAFAAE